jgi:hypothetical protein
MHRFELKWWPKIISSDTWVITSCNVLWVVELEVCAATVIEIVEVVADSVTELLDLIAVHEIAQ